MSSFSDGLQQAAQNAVCDAARAGVVGGLLFAGLTATTVGGLLGGLAVSGLSAVAYASLCNAPLPPEARGRIPFRGGQCPGVRYRIPVFYAVRDKLVPGIVGRNGKDYLVRGKINLIDFNVIEQQGNRVELTIDGSADDDVFELISEGVFIPDPNDPSQQVPRFSYELEPIVAVPEDGSEDLCGDPPFLPPVVPPGSNIVPTNITYINNEGDTVNVPITLNLGLPRVDIRGELNIPIDVRFDFDPTLNFGGDLNFNTGDFTVNFGDPAVPPSGNADDDYVAPDPNNPPPPPPLDVPDPPPDEPTEPSPRRRRIIRGCLVTVSEVDVLATQIFQGDNPDIYAPALGYVQFFIRVGNSGGWTADIPVKNKRQFIECPWFLGAIDVRGTLGYCPIYSHPCLYFGYN